MERTITQNGGLYALQHGATKKYRDARQKRVIGNKIIRTGELLPESFPFLQHRSGTISSHRGQRVIGCWNSRAAALKR
jgi:hypothetical protein